MKPDTKYSFSISTGDVQFGSLRNPDEASFSELKTPFFILRRGPDGTPWGARRNEAPLARRELPPEEPPDYIVGEILDD